MTDKELTKAALDIYRKACKDLECLVKSQGVPVYESMYGMRRWYKHNDNSSLVSNGRKLMDDIISGRIKLQKGNMLVQATPKAVRKLKEKIIKDIVDECRRNISHSSNEIVHCEATIRELVKQGKISEKKLHKLLVQGKI